MRRIFSFLAGAMIGGVFGAALAVLLTPASGEEFRVQIQERAQNVREQVKSAAADRRAELERQLTDLRAPRKPQTPQAE
jgi:gas vesicle protein